MTEPPTPPEQDRDATPPVPISSWILEEPFDSAVYLDRPPVTYAEEDEDEENESTPDTAR